MRYMSNKRTSKLFSKWGAIATIAGALERKVWCETGIGKLYPNLYTLLVGPPASGKTVQTNTIHRLWTGISDNSSSTHKVGLSSINHATIIDELVDARRVVIETDPADKFNSLLVAVNEFSVLMPVPDPIMQAVLSDLYDCHAFGQRRRSLPEPIKLDKPQVNLIGATQPSTLNQIIPAGSWDQGFASRIIFVYSDNQIKTSIWDTKPNSKNEYAILQEDLRVIGKLYGPVLFDEDVKHMVDEWDKDVSKVKPIHPQLKYYNDRRLVHLLKLCVIISMSRNNELSVNAEDFIWALNTLQEVEIVMPKMFPAMQLNGDDRIIQETWYAAIKKYRDNGSKGYISQEAVINFIKKRTPAYNVRNILQLLVASNKLKQTHVAGKTTCYIPVSEKEQESVE